MRSTNNDLADATRGQEIGHALALVALKHDRIALDAAATTEGLLELSAPALEIVVRQAELLDDGRFFTASLFSFIANDGARRTTFLVEWLDLWLARGQAIAQLLERGER